MIKILAMLLLFVCIIGNAQIIVTGKLLNQQTNKGVLFANVYLKNRNIGVISDQDGLFRIELEEIYRNDTLVISTIGYQNKYVSINELSDEQNLIFLTPDSILLPDITICSAKSKRTRVLGNFEYSPKGKYYMRAGDQIAVFIPPPNNRRIFFLRSALFYIKDEGYPNTRFRVHVYAVDTLTNLPGPELISRNIIASVDKGNTWVKVDIENYRIQIPEIGVFIAMEWLPDSKELSYEIYFSNTNSPKDVNGQVLGGIVRKKKYINTFYKSHLSDWMRFRSSPESITSLNAAICVEVNLR